MRHTFFIFFWKKNRYVASAENPIVTHSLMLLVYDEEQNKLSKNSA